MRTAGDDQVSDSNLNNTGSDGRVVWMTDMPALTALPSATGTALRRNPRDSHLCGLSYAIAPAEGRAQAGTIKIESWIYGVQNESIYVPVMNFIFMPPKPGGGGGIKVEELKILSRRISEDEFTGARAMSVALFFINQINAGQVPDYERILSLHQLHPQTRKDKAS